MSGRHRLEILLWSPDINGFFDWFGSLTESEVNADGRMAVDASTAVARRLGQKATPIIDLMTQQLPDELRNQPPSG